MGPVKIVIAPWHNRWRGYRLVTVAFYEKNAGCHVALGSEVVPLGGVLRLADCYRRA